MKFCLKSLALLYTLLNTVASANSLPRFAPYADLMINTHWDSQYQDMEPMDLSAISKKTFIKNYHLAFITDIGNCTPAWGAQSSYSVAAGWGSHLTDKLRADKIGYIISLGGASGNDLSKACSNSKLMETYNQIIKTYQPEGLDFDIENGSADVANIIAALVNIQKDHPKLKISFTLPVLPDGLTLDGKNIVKAAADAHLNFSVNIMAMDYGPSFINDMGEYAIQAATELSLFLKSLYPNKLDADIWHMIEVTPMIGVNDINVEQFTLKNTDTLRVFAEQNNLGGLSMWSIARDNPCADHWASPICSGNNLQTKPYEFTERFLNRSMSRTDRNTIKK
jgi:chitinase